MLAFSSVHRGFSLDSAAAAITDDKVIPNLEVIRLYSFEGVDSGRLGFADHLNLRLRAHTSPLGCLERCVLGGIRPHGRTCQDIVDLGRRHEGLAVPSAESVHGVLVYLRQVVAYGIDDRLVVPLELGGRL